LQPLKEIVLFWVIPAGVDLKGGFARKGDFWGQEVVGLCRQEATCEVVWAGRAWLKSDSELGPREVFCGKVLWGAMGSEIQAGRRILGLCRGYRDL
jgi:hypothetical protein